MNVSEKKRRKKTLGILDRMRSSGEQSDPAQGRDFVPAAAEPGDSMSDLSRPPRKRKVRLRKKAPDPSY